jgi:hypothetical protein
VQEAIDNNTRLKEKNIQKINNTFNNIEDIVYCLYVPVAAPDSYDIWNRLLGLGDITFNKLNL